MGQKGGSSNQAAVRARLLHVHAHTSVLQNTPLYVRCTTKATGAAFSMRWETPVSAGGPQTPQIPGPYAPRPAPLPRIAPAPEKSIKWHSVRGPPHGWRSRDHRPPRPVSPGSCPEACSPVSSPGGWRWCSPPGILGRRCWPPRLLCRRWASMNAVPPGTRRRKGGR